MASSHPKRELQAVLPMHAQEPYLRVLGVNIYVRDQDRSLRFFVDKLGFRVVIDASYLSADRSVIVSPPDGGTILSLISPKSNSKEHRRIGQCKDVVFATEDVARKFHEWEERGVRFHHPPQATLWGGGLFTRFDDIDGNTFWLVSWDDFVHDIEQERRAAAEKAEAERRIAQELEIAKQVQLRLFPQTAPELRTLDYAGICLQAHDVGGDYYDFLNLGRDRLGIIIGDISGKGIAAALLMANFQANLRSQSAIAADDPKQFLGSVNKLFYENTVENVFATMFFTQYDDNERRLRYANCGHYSALLLRSDGKLERLDSTCTVLGLFPEWECVIEERPMSPGDSLVLYTDGVTEAFSEAGEEFGEDRLIETVRKHRDLCSKAMLAAIADEVCRFSAREQHDDITLIVAKCK